MKKAAKIFSIIGKVAAGATALDGTLPPQVSIIAYLVSSIVPTIVDILDDGKINKSNEELN